MWSIEPGSEQDIEDLAQYITSADAAELEAAGLSVRDAVAGAKIEALKFGGKLVCLFGVETHPSSPDGGIPWMLCTDQLQHVSKRAMAQVSREVVAGWRLRFKTLTNLIHRRNVDAMRFVEWLGFTITREPVGPRQEFFVFEWRRNV